MHEKSGIPTLFLKLLHLLILAGVILGVVGGVRQSYAENASKVSSGRIFTKVAVCLFLIVYLAVTGVLTFTYRKKSYIPKPELPLFYGSLLGVAVLVIRMIYSLISAFDPTSSTFARADPNIFAKAFMATTEEMIFMIIMLVLGFIVPRPPPDDDDEMEQGGIAESKVQQ